MTEKKKFNCGLIDWYNVIKMYKYKKSIAGVIMLYTTASQFLWKKNYQKYSKKWMNEIYTSVPGTGTSTSTPSKEEEVKTETVPFWRSKKKNDNWVKKYKTKEIFFKKKNIWIQKNKQRKKMKQKCQNILNLIFNVNLLHCLFLHLFCANKCCI